MSSAYLAVFKYTTRKIMVIHRGGDWKSHQPSWVFSPEETNSTTYSKRYWVSEIVMYSLNSPVKRIVYT